MPDSDDFFQDKENVSTTSKKSKTVEETYQKLTQLEHVLLRPDTYIGSTEMHRTKLWVFDEEIGMNQREVTYVPGLFKIFDEILVNAADNKQRDKTMDTLKVVIDPEESSISVYNNGCGIPVEMHKEENCWVPELIFGHLLTSSNYNDKEKKTTGGRNGYGAKLANIFSTEFTVETADGSRSGRKYKQTWTDNMQNKTKATVKECKESDNWTCITFKPDLSKFGMVHLDVDTVALMKKRVYDMAGTIPGVKVFLKDQRIKIKTFEDYCKLYLSSSSVLLEGEAKYVHYKPNDRWEMVIAASDGQFQQVSFVNNIATTRGGSHVNHVADQLVQMFSDHLGKKHKGLKLKPFQIKGHMWIFLNSLIENPAFDSQTKETLTLKPSAFGSKAEFDDKFFKKMLNGTKIIDGILSFGQEKQEKDMKKTDGKKTGRIVGIPKLEDANDAGTKHAADCTLILTEGDSAKALAVSGLAVVGRNRYGVFPLRGKVANPRDANHEQIMKNEEIKNLKTILGLQQGNKYENGPQGLRYGHVMIMADQDPDGSHIKGLLINLFHYYWPNLLRHPGFLQEFATPIVKAKKKGGGKNEIAFFTLQEYEEWREQVGDGLGGWTIKYYKGLGTSSSQEAKEYFSNLPLHQMDFAWEGAEDGEIIDMVFSKKRADDRKQWLLRYEEDLFVDHNGSEVTYSDFINKELIHFSMMDNMRSIPSLVDGWKPGQRKILYACFKRKLKAEIKVAQLAGYVAEHSAYHHGEQSLAMAIVGMAQNFVGSNNVNVLVPSGQFGTRLQGGADAASPRYIFTYLHPITRFLFHEADDAILKYLNDDGQSIEPQFYVPILPTVLVNGAHGIGTGWSTDVPCYNPRDVVSNLKRLLRQEVMEPMHPWFRGFQGSVELNVSKKGEVSYTLVGKWEKVDETTLVINELPVGKWTQQYKEFLETLMDTEGGKKEPFIKGYREYHTDTTVYFEVSMTEKRMEEAEEVGIAKKFQLSRSLAISNMHLFNADGQIQRYDSPEQIMREFYGVRMEHYRQRKEQLEGELGKQLKVLDNKCRFIKEVIAGTLKVNNRKKTEIVQDLSARGYMPLYKEGKKKAAEGEEQEGEAQEQEQQEGKGSSGGYDYLLNMPILSLTLERVKHLQEERDGKANELEELNKLTPADLWERDLDSIEQEEEKKMKEKGPKVKASQGSKKVLKKKAAKKRRKSWGGDSMSEDDSDVSLDDDSDEEFAAASKPKKPQAKPAASSAPAPKAPAPASSASLPAFKAAASKPQLKRAGSEEEKPRQMKKQDLKDTPDKSAMLAQRPKVLDEDEDEDVPALSLMERLAAKMTDKKVAAPAAKPVKKVRRRRRRRRSQI
ncbi:hypothetical protein GUITHDRAFT_158481 [Guillardia theta CCMP2712]|uniref:DNA topoisomerase 2 n=1 Tax=Guillardia theta (strain CCMP2712) TaxID=905079 RepID=L1IRG4_GUITC|nr:hypothetical protein GUITHDRAFT_158481 [Guillardia theta CCMP2712]EKX38687.1 hypothetical protein GUITHDRAFT_158481 [Guillardia theta CCMP2712]|eukprot:XP_005825667.1 hypothetical protein GUITHDRAFT_158481 [Guillardia theta CCMP2712]